MRNPLLMKGSDRVTRGGAWYYTPSTLRPAGRNDFWPTDHYDIIGFRLFRSQDKN
jgi:formylglycine-generating enzyme required for sulfatase activity